MSLFFPVRVSYAMMMLMAELQQQQQQQQGRGYKEEEQTEKKIEANEEEKRREALSLGQREESVRAPSASLSQSSFFKQLPAALMLPSHATIKNARNKNMSALGKRG